MVQLINSDDERWVLEVALFFLKGVLEVAILASNHISWHNHFLRHVTELSIVSSIAITIYHLLCQVLPLSTISTAVSD